MIHFTCIEQSLKTYFGYHFGGFGDMDQYYSDPPVLLGTANISGMIDAVHAQVAFAAQLAHNSRRTLIWPDIINLMQYHRDDQNGKIVINYIDGQPGIRTISWASADRAGLKAVEGSYLANFRRINHVELETVYFNAHDSISVIEEEISKLSPTQVPILSFTHFSPPIFAESEGEEEAEDLEERARWLEEKEEKWFKQTFEGGGYKEFSKDFLYKLKKCSNANWGADCLSVCPE